MIRREVQGEVALLRFAHGKANALDLELLVALEAAVRAEAEGDARAVVLTGSGSIFCAGVDLKRLCDGGAAYVHEFLPALDRALLALHAFEKPLVAAINGHAIAGGAVIALACDRRLLARGKALFGTPELRVGVPFPLSALEILRCALNPAQAAELALEGRNHSGDEALARGFVHELVQGEALLARAMESARQLADTPAVSFALTKRGLRADSHERIERLQPSSARATLEAWSSPAVLDAVADFVRRTLPR